MTKIFMSFQRNTVLLLLLALAPLHLTSALQRRSDDVSVTSLLAVVTQQAESVKALQAQLQATNTRIAQGNADLDTKVADLKTQVAALVQDNNSLKNKVAALGQAVAFSVRFKQDDGVHGIPLANNAPLRFDDVLLNAGGGYDAQTGFFTAPAAGTYGLFLTQMGTGSGGVVDLALVKHDGTVLDIVYAKGHEDQGSSLVTTRLAKGEQVWVRHQGGTGVRGGWWTVFSGYLITAD